MNESLKFQTSQSCRGSQVLEGWWSGTDRVIDCTSLKVEGDEGRHFVRERDTLL